MEIIIPAAGLSTRFPNMRPKYTLVDHNGNLMIENVIKPFYKKNNVFIGILKEHQEKYGAADLLRCKFKNNINIIILDDYTKGPADTVYKIIQKSNINKKSGILIRDCDSFFDHKILKDNYVCTYDFASSSIIKTPNSKSYIISNDKNIITSIAEKKIISNKFCVGGYKFNSAGLFCDSYDTLCGYEKKEIYVSDIVDICIKNNILFHENKVKNYVDVGTFEQWKIYNDKSVIFCDIDGTIIIAQSKHEYDNPPIILENNVKLLLKMIEEGSEIIFTTARPNSCKIKTNRLLKKLGFKKFKLITGLKNCKRILINDFNNANPYPRAIAVNIKRNNDNINDFLL